MLILFLLEIFVNSNFSPLHFFEIWVKCWKWALRAYSRSSEATQKEKNAGLHFFADLAVNHWIWFNFQTFSFVGLYLLGALSIPLVIWLLLKLPFPRAMVGLSAIAGNTARSVMKQPIFSILMIIGVMAVLIFPWIPYNTLGEDVKIMKSQSMTIIKVCILFLFI